MLYRVFNSQQEVDEANVRWLTARHNAGVFDTKQGNIVNPEKTSGWDRGKLMLDGRIACEVPDNWKDEFGGLELELTEEDFPAIDSEV